MLHEKTLNVTWDINALHLLSCQEHWTEIGGLQLTLEASTGFLWWRDSEVRCQAQSIDTMVHGYYHIVTFLSAKSIKPKLYYSTLTSLDISRKWYNLNTLLPSQDKPARGA